MAHFAEINENNEILRVLVVGNDDIQDENGIEQENLGIEFLKNLFGDNTTWLQTSYNINFRGNYAEVGGSYDPINDRFIPAKPYPSWVWDENILDWIAPVDKPEGVDERWGWSETKYNEDGDGWQELYTYPSWIQNKIWVWNIDFQYFEAIQPYPSWSLNENDLWQAPLPYPDSGNWEWSEAQQNWIEYTP